jgi:integrase
MSSTRSIVTTVQKQSGRQYSVSSRDVTLRSYITDDVAAACDRPEVTEYRVWDDTLKGFCLRVHPSGKVVFCIKHRVDGRPRWTTIGLFRSPWSADAARGKAQELLLSCAPPLARRIHPNGGLTVGALVELYLREAPQTHLSKRESSWRTEGSNLRAHVVPLIGNIPLADLTRDQVARMVADVASGKSARTQKTGRQGGIRVRGGSGSANVVFRNVRTMLFWAQSRNLITSNPATQISLPKRASPARSLSLDETRRLIATLDQLEAAGEVSDIRAAAIRVLAFTGARRSEICELRWSEIDFERRVLVLPPERTKMGNKTGGRRIPINQNVVAILKKLKRTSDYAFPKRDDPTSPICGLQAAWVRLCKRAELGHLRIHDLRHTFASLALDNGENIAAISAVLGHSTIQMTQRYLHIQDGAGGHLADRTGKLFDL